MQKIFVLPEANRPELRNLGKFSSDVGLLIRNEFLLSKAHNLGIDRSAPVDSSVNAFLSNFAYQFYLKKFYRAMTVGPDVLNYYKHRTSQTGDSVPLRPDVLPTMQTLEQYKLYYAARRLHRFLLQRFSNVPVYIDRHILEEEARRIDWDHPLRMLVIPR